MTSYKSYHSTPQNRIYIHPIFNSVASHDKTCMDSSPLTIHSSWNQVQRSRKGQPVKHNNYAKVSDQYFWRQTEKMAVNLSVTPEQAAMLIPLLQQISSSNGGTPPRITSDYDRDSEIGVAGAAPELAGSDGAGLSTPVRSSFSSTPSSSETPISTSTSYYSSSSEYTTDELLVKKRKNRKSTSAQSYLLVSCVSIA